VFRQEAGWVYPGPIASRSVYTYKIQRVVRKCVLSQLQYFWFSHFEP
jgi:hypothetical protein